MTSPTIPRDTYLDEMVHHYLACAAWSSCNIDDDGNDESLDGYSFSEAAESKAREVCGSFLDVAFPFLGDWAPCEAGHDLWLTSAGHGSGFWDRGLPDGSTLTGMAKTFPMDAYLNDSLEIELQ